MIHFIIYLGLALAYFEAAHENFIKRNRRGWLRDAVIALLYSSIVFTLMDHNIAIGVISTSMMPFVVA
ncbi:MAG TPA: hypothetical protein VN838_05685 [Bradyrhizobium sp.]|nr:hypothetical protein [Bradyrhizobium sp.]